MEGEEYELFNKDIVYHHSVVHYTHACMTESGGE